MARLRLIASQWIFKDPIRESSLRSRRVSLLGLYTAAWILGLYSATPLEVARLGATSPQIAVGFLPGIGQVFWLAFVQSRDASHLPLCILTVAIGALFALLRFQQVKRLLPPTSTKPAA